MAYSKEQMIYMNYKWTARADHDNPNIIQGTDHSELNQTEGYEMLYFINSLAKTWSWKAVSLSSYQHLERVIKEEVPSTVRTHGGIKGWIESHYSDL